MVTVLERNVSDVPCSYNPPLCILGRGGGRGVADVAVAIPMSNRVGLSHIINQR